MNLVFGGGDEKLETSGGRMDELSGGYNEATTVKR
jgi:hypothetical protein